MDEEVIPPAVNDDMSGDHSPMPPEAPPVPPEAPTMAMEDLSIRLFEDLPSKSGHRAYWSIQGEDPADERSFVRFIMMILAEVAGKGRKARVQLIASNSLWDEEDEEEILNAVLEFESLEKAAEFQASPKFQKELKRLGDLREKWDFRQFEGHKEHPPDHSDEPTQARRGYWQIHDDDGLVDYAALVKEIASYRLCECRLVACSEEQQTRVEGRVVIVEFETLKAATNFAKSKKCVKVFRRHGGDLPTIRVLEGATRPVLYNCEPIDVDYDEDSEPETEEERAKREAREEKQLQKEQLRQERRRKEQERAREQQEREKRLKEEQEQREREEEEKRLKEQAEEEEAERVREERVQQRKKERDAREYQRKIDLVEMHNWQMDEAEKREARLSPQERERQQEEQRVQQLERLERIRLADKEHRQRMERAQQQQQERQRQEQQRLDKEQQQQQQQQQLEQLEQKQEQQQQQQQEQGLELGQEKKKKKKNKKKEGGEGEKAPTLESS